MRINLGHGYEVVWDRSQASRFLDYYDNKGNCYQSVFIPKMRPTFMDAWNAFLDDEMGID